MMCKRHGALLRRCCRAAPRAVSARFTPEPYLSLKSSRSSLRIRSASCISCVCIKWVCRSVHEWGGSAAGRRGSRRCAQSGQPLLQRARTSFATGGVSSPPLGVVMPLFALGVSIASPTRSSVIGCAAEAGSETRLHHVCCSVRSRPQAALQSCQFYEAFVSSLYGCADPGWGPFWLGR
jgi:hypothetical protein